MKHNIIHNYLSANGAGEQSMERDIIISEIAKLIVDNPERVKLLLQQNGFSVQDNTST